MNKVFHLLFRCFSPAKCVSSWVISILKIFCFCKSWIGISCPWTTSIFPCYQDFGWFNDRNLKRAEYLAFILSYRTCNLRNMSKLIISIVTITHVDKYTQAHIYLYIHTFIWKTIPALYWLPLVFLSFLIVIRLMNFIINRFVFDTALPFTLFSSINWICINERHF
jgi:hypothetical protein